MDEDFVWITDTAHDNQVVDANEENEPAVIAVPTSLPMPPPVPDPPNADYSDNLFIGGGGGPGERDQCPDDPDKRTPGICGCGVADVDTDDDGIFNCDDNCPITPNTDQQDTDADAVGDVCDCSYLNADYGVTLGTGRYVNPSKGDNTDNHCASYLRPCLTIAYALSQAQPGDTLMLAGGTFVENSLPIAQEINIFGWGPEYTYVNAAGSGSVFSVAIAQATFCGLTITGGSNENGGGIMNNGGDITVANGVVTNNEALGAGGGIATFNLGVVNLIQSTLSNNRATFGSGISMNNSSALISQSTINGNHAYSGGGIYTINHGLVDVVNSTISGNAADTSGGGINNDTNSIISIAYSTITENAATIGGYAINNAGLTVTVGGTIVANQAENGTNCSGVITSAAYSIDSGTSCGFTGIGDQQNVDMYTYLLPLANYGGLTETHALVNGASITNPAVLGGAASCSVNIDQRGISRPYLNHCDIGSFEWQAHDP